jgi:hypothetical protein
MDNFIDSLNHLNEEEKLQTKQIRVLMSEINLICQNKPLNVILNSLDLLKEFYIQKTKTQ